MRLPRPRRAVVRRVALDFSDLRGLFVSCMLKRSPEPSNTRALADLAIAVMERNGVHVDIVRAVDHEIATGVWPGHDRARLGGRRPAGDLRAAGGGRRPLPHGSRRRLPAHGSEDGIMRCAMNILSSLSTSARAIWIPGRADRRTTPRTATQRS